MQTVDRSVLALIVFSFLVAACGEDGTDLAGPDGPSSIEAVGATSRADTVDQTLPDPLVVRVLDENGDPVAGTDVAWAATGGQLSETGTSTDAAGEASVTWTLGTDAGTDTATASVEGLDPVRFIAEVQPGAVAALTADPDTARLAAIGATAGITAMAEDQHGNEAAADISFATTDTGIATVDGAGVVEAVANGVARVVASAAGLADTVVVIIAQEADEVTVQPSGDTLAAGDTLRLTATAVDANGHDMAGATFDWSSSDTAIATVDDDGLVTARDSGTAAITATSGGAAGEAQIVVTGSPDDGTPVEWTTGSAGFTSSCAVTVDGDAYCWGQGNNGELGNGGTSNSDRPVPVTGSQVWVAISAGIDHTCGVADDDTAYCWGTTTFGRLGNDTSAFSVAEPVTVEGGHAWATVRAGADHTCGITSNGDAYCWGGNGYGQFGNGTSDTTSAAPSAVDGAHTWATISTGRFHTCGVTTGGDGYCWGYNSAGQLGDQSVTDRDTPTPVSGGHTWAAISAGNEFSCGITTGGEAYCWGDNTYGKLGDGSQGDWTVPTPVAGDLTWAAISAGTDHACGITTSGDAYCWGNGSAGEIGDGSTETANRTPVLVAGSLGWQGIAAGGAHTLGLTSDGSAYAWGLNFYGQVGDGTTSERTTPTAVANP